LAAVPVGSPSASAFTSELLSDLPASSDFKQPIVDVEASASGQAGVVEQRAAADAATLAVFDLHSSTAPQNGATLPQYDESAADSNSDFSQSNGPSAATQPSSSSIISIPQAPQTTPQNSQVPSSSLPLELPPPKVAHVSGVKGSAIRSFLQTMQAKAASDSASPETTIHQQRASAVELIRLRSALYSESSRKDGLTAGAVSAARAASIDSRRHGAPDKVEVDEEGSDDEHYADRMFKNQKIVCVARLCECSWKPSALTRVFRKYCKPRCRRYRASSMLCAQCQAFTVVFVQFPPTL
jgi:hypothetical protein